MQPFHFKALDENNNITLSLEAAVRADAVSKALRLKNAVAQSFKRKPGKPGAAGAMDALAEEPEINSDDDDDIDETAGSESLADRGAAPVLFRGFMTKQGAVRKNWKRRFFELYTTGGRVCKLCISTADALRQPHPPPPTLSPSFLASPPCFRARLNDILQSDGWQAACRHHQSQRVPGCCARRTLLL